MTTKVVLDKMMPKVLENLGAPGIQIVSDGTAAGTIVLDADGNEIKWGGSALETIEIDPIASGECVTVVFKVCLVSLGRRVQQ